MLPEEDEDDEPELVDEPLDDVDFEESDDEEDDEDDPAVDDSLFAGTVLVPDERLSVR